MKRIIPLFVLILLFSISVTAPPPSPIGIAGVITVNGEPIEDNITVYITNINTSTTVTAKTENGYYANALSATDGNKIKVNFTYRGKNYENFTTVNTSLLTHWVNFTITIEIEPTPPCIDIPETFYGTVGEEVVFDASNCYDLDGEIVSYEWVIYDYPPISLSGKTVSYTWDKPCSLVGLFRVTDNDGLNASISKNITIEEKPVEYHRLIISSNKPVSLVIIGNGTLYEDNGTYFVVRLPEGTYTIQWEYDGKIDSDVVLLNKDKEYSIDISDDDNDKRLIPGFEFVMFIIAFAVLLRRKFNQL